MQRKQTKELCHDYYESWDEFVDACRNNREYPEGSYAYAYNAAIHAASECWSGSVTFDQACNLAEFGWPDGRQFMSDMDFEIDPQAREFVVENEQRIYDVAGDIPDVPRAIAGDPCSMITIQATEQPTKLVRLVVTVSARATINAETMMNRGGSIASWIDQIESKGWALELVARRSAKSHGYTTIVDVVVKQPGEPMDIDRVLFAMANPAMTRMLLFHAQDLQPHSANIGHGRGSTFAYSKDLGDEIYIPPTEINQSQEKAMEDITDIMCEFGTAA